MSAQQQPIADQDQQEQDYGEPNPQEQRLDKKLQEVFQSLKSENFFQSLTIVVDDTKKTNNPDNIDHLLKFLTDLEECFKGKTKTSQEKRSWTPWSYSSSPIVKIYVVVTGQTFGAHDAILGQMMKGDSIKVEKTKDLQKCDIIVVFCPIVSRIGSDVEEAMKKFTGDKKILLVLMHHNRNTDYSCGGTTWSEIYANVVLYVHVLYHESKQGLLKCTRNTQAVQQIQDMLKNLSGSN